MQVEISSSVDNFSPSFLTKPRENYCVQCHSPSAFVSGEDLSGILSLNDINQLVDPIKEGISCQFCHNTINTSNDIYTQDNVAALAEYHLSIDKEVMFGPILEPEDNNYHESFCKLIYELIYKGKKGLK